MKKFIIHLFISVLTLPLHLLFLVFKGKSYDENIFIKDFISLYLDKIYSYLNITDLPEIETYESPKRYIFKDGTTTLDLGTLKDNPFYNIDMSTMHISLILKNLRNRILLNYKTIYKSDNSKIIKINLIGIKIHCINNNILTKFKIVNTLMHELTHYSQFVNNIKLTDSTNIPTFASYSKLDTEKEARRNGILFLLKYPSVIKFILTYK